MKFIEIQILIGLILLASVSSGVSSEIHEAVQKGDFKTMSAIVGSKGESVVNERLSDGITPLHIAAAANNKQVVAFLLSMGADINAKTTNGFTPLHWAANKDSSGTAELLISMGAELNVQSSKGVTPLHWAASHNATNVVKLLIISGADIYKTSEKGYKPLHWAIMQDADDVYPMLLFKEASDKESLKASENTPAKKLDDMDWNSMIAGANGVSTDPVLLENTPRALPGEDLSIPLGHDIDLPFIWIDGLNIWFGKYEVTNEQYRQFKPNHSSLFREELSLNGNRQPAVFIDWKQAKIYCTWLNRKYAQNIPDEYEFRLPTEQEWMNCARCDVARMYPWGPNMPPLYGNYSDESLRKYISDWQGISDYNDSFVVSCNVEDSGSNEWGIYGLAGNVWEWCEDWYDSTYRYKTLHGGSWDYDEEHMIRISSRGFDRPDTRDDTIGLRIVIAPK